MAASVLAISGVSHAVADSAGLEVEYEHGLLHEAACVTATEFGWIWCQAIEKGKIAAHERCLIDNAVTSYALQLPRERALASTVVLSSIHRTRLHVYVVMDRSDIAVFPASAHNPTTHESAEAVAVHVLDSLVADCSSNSSTFQCCTTEGKLLTVHDQHPTLLGEVFLPRHEHVRHVQCSNHHSIALTKRGSVFTWGNSSHGRLGVFADDSALSGSDEPSSAPQKIESLDGTGAMRADGSFTGIKLIACGMWHSMAVSYLDDAFFWGWNNDGALGLQLSADNSCPLGQVQHLPRRLSALDAIIGDDDSAVNVCCGATFTIIATSNPQLLVFGRLGFSQEKTDSPILQGTDVWPSIKHHFPGKDVPDLTFVAGRWHLCVIAIPN